MELTKSKKQILILYATTLIGTFIGVFVSILNTRFLEPIEYGNVRYVNNIIGFFSGIFLFGYFVSGCRLLALAKSKEESSRIKGGMVFILGLTIVALMLIMLICGLIHQFILAKSFASLFYYAIPVCGSALCLNYINTSAQGDNSIMTISAARLFPSLAYLIIAFLVYRSIGASSRTMLLLQSGISLTILLLLIFHNKPSFKRLKSSLSKLKAENKIYGLQVYYGSLVSVTVPYIAGITLGNFSENNAGVGFYNLALTISMPLAMLPNVIGTTYFKKFANEGAISGKVQLTTWLMSMGSLAAFALLIFPLVRIMYDVSYSSVAEYASLLAIGSTFQGLGDLYNRFLGAHGQGRQLKLGAWASGAVSIIGYTIGVYFYGIYGAVATRIVAAITYFVFMMHAYQKYHD